MMPATLELARRISVAGQCALIVLGIAWAVFERPAPFVNIAWRDGLPEPARREVESQLYLENGEPSDGTWRYELASPRTADIRAIVAHPDVRDTHRIERQSAAISADAGRGELRVWWAGPFKGAAGRLEFRLLFGVIACMTVLCAFLPALSSIFGARSRR